MEKLSRAEKYRDYRSGLQNDSEKNITTDQLRDLQQRLIEVEKKFGNTSKTESDMNRGYKSYSSFNDAYDIFDEQTGKEVARQEKVIPKINSKPSQEEFIKIDTQTVKQEPQEESVFEEVRPDIINRITAPTYEDNDDGDDFVVENVKSEPVAGDEDIESALRGILSKKISGEDKEKNVEDYINKIKELLSSDKEEKEPVEQVAPKFESEPEYVPSPKSDTDSIPSVESLIDEINTVNINDQDAKEIEEPKAVQSEETVVKPEENIAEFAENKIQEVKSLLQNVVIEKPEIKPIVPKEDHSKEFSELCDNVNMLAKEIEVSSFATPAYVPPHPELPKQSFEALKNDVKNDINSDSSMNSFMNDLKKEVNAYNQSVSNVTIDELKDNIIDDQRHKENAESEVNNELNKQFEATVSTEVSKILDEINATKQDDFSAADMINNVETVVPDTADFQQGKTIAFESEDLLKDTNIKDNTILISEPIASKPGVDDQAIHTMAFETEELYKDDEKSSTVLNIVLTVLIVLAVLALGVITYFFLLTRGII